jgi:hypothetical protein
LSDRTNAHQGGEQYFIPFGRNPTDFQGMAGYKGALLRDLARIGRDGQAAGFHGWL